MIEQAVEHLYGFKNSKHTKQVSNNFRQGKVLCVYDKEYRVPKVSWLT